MLIKIIDNTYESQISFRTIEYPAPVVARLKYTGDSLLILDNVFEFYDLTTSERATHYELIDGELKFNWSQYNKPTYITINNVNYTDNQTILIDATSSELTITIYRDYNLPVIIKNYKDEIVFNEERNGSVNINLVDNTVNFTNGLIASYTFTEFEDDGRDYVDYLLYEFNGLHISGFFNTNTNDAIILKQVNAREYMTITFYKNSAEENRVNKTNFLVQYYQCSGVLKENTSIIRPSILIEFDLATYREIMKCNYCYINMFDRYYYIKDIICVNTSLYQINLVTDVLMSFKNIILTQTAIIARNENDYNNDLVDERLQVEREYDYTVIPYNNGLLDTSSINSTVMQATYYSTLVTILNDANVRY